MKKLRAAILEDNPILLKDLVRDIKEFEKLDIIIKSTSTADFCEQVEKIKPDCLIMDIDINGQSMNGIDICNKFELPTLFVSGKNSQYYKEIEELNINSDQAVMHISKPITLEKLSKILPKFLNCISLLKPKEMKLSIQGQDEFIKKDDIVFLTTAKEDMSRKSNNKKIYFTNRPPETLYDFSFKNLETHGFSEDDFVKLHRSYIINKLFLDPKNIEDLNLKVKAIGTSGEEVLITLNVSSDLLHSIKKTIG